MRLWMTFLTLLLGGGLAEDCSESKMKIFEYDMNNCMQAIAMKASSELYNSADPASISHIMCSTQATIVSDCVQPMRKCFSPEYTSWLVEPMKNYLHEIAIAKVGTQYDQECKDYNIQDNKVMDYNREEYGQAVDYDYTAKHHEQYQQNYDYTQKQQEQHERNYDYTQKQHEQNYDYTQKQQEQHERNYDYTQKQHEQYEGNYDYTQKQHEQHEQNYDNTRKQHEENHEHYYSTQQVMDENRRRLCYETDIYDKMGNCSHYAALKVHYDIKDVTDPNMLNKIACHALNVISTDCVAGLKKCLNKEDANSYINIQVGQWKSYIIEQIEGRADIKLSLDNCHHLNVEYTERDLQRKDNDFNDYYKERQEDMYKETRTEAYKEPQEYNNDRHDSLNQENENCSPSKKQMVEDQLDACYQSVATEAYSSIYSLTDPGLMSDTICGIQNRLEYDCVKHVKECFTPEYIQWLVGPMKQYLHDLGAEKFGIKFVVSCSELDHRDDYDHSRHEPDHQNVHVPTSTQNSHTYVEYDNEYNSGRSRGSYRTCSNIKIADYLTEIGNCSYHTAINVHRRLQTETNPSIISKIICDALASIGSNCVDRIGECYTPEDVRKLKVEEHSRMREYMLHSVNTKVSHHSIHNCDEIVDNYNDNRQANYDNRQVNYDNRQANYDNYNDNRQANSDNRQAYYDPNQHYNNGMDYYSRENTDERYQVGGPNADGTGHDYSRYQYNIGHGHPDTSTDMYDVNSGYGPIPDMDQYGNEHKDRDAYERHNQGIDSYDQKKKGRSGRAYDYDYEQMGVNQPPKEGCSDSQNLFADEHLNNCTRLEAKDAASRLTHSPSPEEAYTIMCSALTNIKTMCAQYLRQCHSDDYVNWMIEPMKSYLLNLVEGRVEEQSLQDC